MEMAKHFELWVITEEHEFRDDIERYLRENGPIENLHFRFVPRTSPPTKSGEVSRFRLLYYSCLRLVAQESVPVCP